MRRKIWLTVVLLAMLLAVTSLARADVPNQINYQGHLTDSDGSPLDTTISMTFAIYDDSSTGSLVLWTETQTGVEVSAGLFNVLLGVVTSIPDTVFADDWRWLGIQVGSDPEIAPRTKLVTVPYAFRVGTVDGSTGGVISGDVSIQSDLDLDGDLRVTGKATIGTNQTNTGTSAFVAGENNTVNNYGSSVGGGSSNVASEMYATISGGASNQANGEYSVVDGGGLNIAGGQYSAVGGGLTNRAEGLASTVAGGDGNQSDSSYSTISGGKNNIVIERYGTVSGGHDDTVSGYASTVGGGYINVSTGSASTVAGGYGNRATENSSSVGGGGWNVASGLESTVSGGGVNTASGTRSTVAGGYWNAADGYHSVVSGGFRNSNAGDYSVLLGGEHDTLTSDANHSMGFGTGIYVSSSYQVTLFDGSYSGRLGLNRDDQDGGANHPIHVGTNTSNGNGAHLTAGGTWTNGSSRTIKENFQSLNVHELLTKISSLPVEKWNYKGTDEQHIGPVSEDFVAAFDVGTVQNGRRDNKYLSPGDVAGIALAGVKELIQKNEELSLQNQELRDMLEKLAQKVNQLENEK